MKKCTRYIIAGLIFLYSFAAKAQSGFYVPVAGKIFFSGDTSTIFSNVMNRGQLGVGKNAFVNFSGRTWENDPLSLITDESNGGNGITGTGGWIRFLSNGFRQQIKGGYNAATRSGPSFSNLQLQNRFGVELAESSVKTRREFTFTNGLVYLYDHIFVLGDNNPGKINGYDSSRFFVTGNKPNSGILMRENIRRTDRRIDFPVGTSDISYTPAAIKSNSILGDDYYVTVFDSVRSGLFSNNYIIDESVNKTWEIGKRFRPGYDDVEVYLQHLNRDEGSYFKTNRQLAYVSQFNGTIWDLGTPQEEPAPGYLNSIGLMPTSGVNTREFSQSIRSSSYFTKFTGLADTTLKTKLWFNAVRTGYNNVRVYWNTKPEINELHFIVQRRLANEELFTDIDTVATLAQGGVSFVQLNYSMNDPNGYTGYSFYRLKVVSTLGTYFYSYIVVVGNDLGGSLNFLWPNPTPNNFFLGLNPVWRVKHIVIYNAIGQKVKQEKVNGRTIIEMGGLIPGTYFITLVHENNTVIETKKLVVYGR